MPYAPLRLSFAVVALAAALTAFLVTKPKIEEVNSALTSTRDNLTKSQEAERKASAEAKSNKSAREEAERQLAATKEERDGAVTRVQQ